MQRSSDRKSDDEICRLNLKAGLPRLSLLTSCCSCHLLICPSRPPLHSLLVLAGPGTSRKNARRPLLLPVRLLFPSPHRPLSFPSKQITICFVLVSPLACGYVFCVCLFLTHSSRVESTDDARPSGTTKKNFFCLFDSPTLSLWLSSTNRQKCSKYKEKVGDGVSAACVKLTIQQ
jgi:hypothetical protein